MLEFRVILKRFEISVARRKKTVFSTVGNGLFQILKGLLAVPLKSICRGECVKDVVPFFR